MDRELTDAEKCVREVEEIMKKYDCGGSVIVASKDYGAHKFIIPEWSTWTWDVANMNAYFHHKKGKKDDTVATIHLLQMVCERSKGYVAIAGQSLDAINEKMPIEGGPRRMEESEI